MKSPLFTDDRLNRRLDRDGSVRLPLLDTAAVERLKALYQDRTADGASGFHASMFHPDRSYREALDRAIRDELAAVWNRVFRSDMVPLYGNYMVKEPDAQSGMKVHQDWTYVDEEQFDSYAIWVPLQDLDETNGIFTVVPRSHHLNNTVRGPGITCPFHGQWEMLRSAYARPLDLRAGEAVVWNHRLAHQSPPNMSDAPRIAVTAIVVPQNAEVFHFYADPGSPRVTRYAVDHDFFMDYRIGERPDAPALATFDYVERERDADELHALLRPASWLDRLKRIARP